MLSVKKKCVRILIIRSLEPWGLYGSRIEAGRPTYIQTEGWVGLCIGKESH